MKANELMIGDWVLYNETHQQILEISGIDDEVYLETDELVHQSEIQPIPLTPEILEKNEFICNIHNIYELSVDTDTFNNFISYQPNYGGIYICKETSKGDFLSEIQLKLQYVHELQNAMNLFKIEKEIVL